jgi:hypothetical protein
VHMLHNLSLNAHVVIGSSLFLYFTLWLLATPFFDPNHPFLKVFLRREVAILVVSYSLILLTSIIWFVVGMYLILS